MKISLAQVLEALGGCGFSVPGPTCASELSFCSVEVYAGQPEEPDVLYAVDGGVPAGGNAAQFIVAKPACPAEGVFGIVADASAVQAVNLVNRYMARAAECLDQMRVNYYRERDLQALCQTLSDFVGNPVLAHDDALLPVAQTDFPREFALRLFGSEVLSPDYVYRTIPHWSRNEDEDVFAHRGAIRTENPDEEASSAVCNIIGEEGFQGMLEIFMVHKPISEADMAMLEEACDIVSAVIPYRDNSFLLSKLEGRTTHEGLTNSWLASLRWRPDDRVYVIAVELPSAYSSSKVILEHALRMLGSLLPHSISVQMGDMPVYVANDRLLPREKAMRSMAPFLSNAGEGACVGTSETMVGVGGLHAGYAHARFAAQLARRRGASGVVVKFEDCRFAFFTDLCNMTENRNLVVDRSVERMFADDESTGSENTLTAMMYIETGFNLAATARALSVHRNTVAYRLKHIAERYGLDLSSPIADHELVFQTLLSCKLLLELE